MTTWKFIFMMLVIVVPGGAMVLLAMATAKALVASRDRWLRLGMRRALVPVESVARPMSAREAMADR